MRIMVVCGQAGKEGKFRKDTRDVGPGLSMPRPRKAGKMHEVANTFNREGYVEGRGE